MGAAGGGGASLDGGIAWPHTSCLVPVPRMSARACVSMYESVLRSRCRCGRHARLVSHSIYIYRVGSNKVSHNVHRELKRVGANEKADFPYLLRRAETDAPIN